VSLLLTETRLEGENVPDGDAHATDHRPEEETEWMLEFQRGSEAAFERLVLAYQSRMERFLLARLKDTARAEDLTQEVFLRVYKARATYRPEAQFRTWLYTIANRLALNELRAVRRRRRICVPWRVRGATQDTEDGGAFEALAEASPDPHSGNVLDFLERKEFHSVLKRLMDRLPGQQRSAVYLQSAEGLSYDEIARALGTTVSAVKSLLVRARENLRVGLERYLGGSTPGAESDRGAERQESHERER
jgi:RNA polymerase sigma-70 factor (ECF subfamily)